MLNQTLVSVKNIDNLNVNAVEEAIFTIDKSPVAHIILLYFLCPISRLIVN